MILVPTEKVINVVILCLKLCCCKLQGTLLRIASHAHAGLQLRENIALRTLCLFLVTWPADFSLFIVFLLLPLAQNALRKPSQTIKAAASSFLDTSRYLWHSSNARQSA
jgi:hypothetical protein